MIQKGHHEHETAEQVRSRHIRDLGPDLGPVFNLLQNDVIWLHARWKLYRQLYARSPERVDFLNKVAGHFAGVLQNTLYEDVLLNLARLTDPPRSGSGQENLSLRKLPRLIPDPALRSAVEALVRSALKACEGARTWRNKYIAHRDLALALASTSDPPGAPSRAEIEAALGAIRAVLDRLEPLAYELFVPAGRDADSLIHYLLMGSGRRSSGSSGLFRESRGPRIFSRRKSEGDWSL
jgi:hypothetical protein